jgi:hypothetical protein
VNRTTLTVVAAGVALAYLTSGWWQVGSALVALVAAGYELHELWWHYRRRQELQDVRIWSVACGAEVEDGPERQRLLNTDLHHIVRKRQWIAFAHAAHRPADSTPDDEADAAFYVIAPAAIASFVESRITHHYPVPECLVTEVPVEEALLYRPLAETLQDAPGT